MNQVGRFLWSQLDHFGIPYNEFILMLELKGGAICGGFALGIATNYVYPESDIDVFQCTKNAYDNVEEHIVSIIQTFYSWEYRLDCSKTNYPYRLLTFFRMINGCKKVIQWIVQPPDDILAHPIDYFDISVCCTTIQFPFGPYYPIIRSLYPNDVAYKLIKINPLFLTRTYSGTLDSKTRTASRIVKYMKRGYICDPSFPESLDEYLHLCRDPDDTATLEYEFRNMVMCVSPPQNV
jgi:hypothetical protein